MTSNSAVELSCSRKSTGEIVFAYWFCPKVKPEPTERPPNGSRKHARQQDCWELRWSLSTWGGDAHIECKPAHAIEIARRIRLHRPSIVLAPLDHQNQHPDHWKTGRLTREAARLARYGGLEEIRDLAVHQVSHLFYYGITGMGIRPGESIAASLVIDISEVHKRWNQVMNCHRSQLKTKNYLDLQNARARLLGIEIGAEYAMKLYSEEPIRVDSLFELTLSARNF